MIWVRLIVGVLKGLIVLGAIEYIMPRMSYEVTKQLMEVMLS